MKEYKKERDTPFDSAEEARQYHHRERIPCLECGKLLRFLPRHIWFVHGLRANEYREIWNIPRSVKLAGLSWREKRSQATHEMIRKGILCPEEQIAMMHEKRKNMPSRRLSPQHTESIRRNILIKQIWKYSPVIKTVSAALKAEAIRRMENRQMTGETVDMISSELDISVSRLYYWVKKARTGE
jgi:transposase-like protein